MIRCSCGLKAVIRTSWTNQNSGRLLYGCPTLSPTCVNFLRWFDLPMCQREVPLLALGRHLEEIHVTWARFWKKRDKMANGHKRRLEVSVTNGGDSV
ncbi:zinc finger, GRF-type containing protein [Tanacetum coccineum]